MRSPSHHRYTWDQYLSLEKDSSVKHEFLDGEIFAMAGGTPEHAALGLAVGAELRSGLKGKPCRVYSSDLRVRVLSTGLSTYPDATVICGELQRDPSDANIALNPRLIVEVTSGSTESYDRGEKFEHYRMMPSLVEYVLVSHRERLIEVFRRGESGSWQRLEAREGGVLRLDAIGCELSVDAVYANLELRST